MAQHALMWALFFSPFGARGVWDCFPTMFPIVFEDATNMFPKLFPIAPDLISLSFAQNSTHVTYVSTQSLHNLLFYKY
jgi:hypothetical protein